MAVRLSVCLCAAIIFAHISPAISSLPPDQTAAARVHELRAIVSAYIDSLHASSVEEIFTLGRGGNAPQGAIEKMNRVLDGSFRNPEADRISAALQSWGRRIRGEFHDLGEPIITRIVIEKSTHTARCYHGDNMVLHTRIAVGNPAIGMDTPVGSYHVIYVDWKPVSRWMNGDVPYGHDYNPYGARQIPFFRNWTMHGNNEPTALGKDISKGCVRFHNAEIMVIAELVQAVKTRIEVIR